MATLDPNDDVDRRESTTHLSGRRSSDVMRQDLTQAKEGVMSGALTMVIFGASGDLAKKKTFPTIWSLYLHDYLPENVEIIGYARTKMTADELVETHLRKYIKAKTPAEEAKLAGFFKLLRYQAGSYDKVEDFQALDDTIRSWEKEQEAQGRMCHRMLYLALPPSVFMPVTTNIRAALMDTEGSVRVVVEKPFGKDAESSAVLSAHLSKLFTEEQIYRIDHYLGKEMVQNMLVMRFANRFFQPLWNRDNIQCVRITFKEPFGTQGRGGYFDEFGIIRDIAQNHLLQVLCMVAMEKPVSLRASDLRDEKVKVLKAIPPVTLANTVLGQYVASHIPGNEESNEGYRDDPTVPPQSNTPTYASMVLYINNERWEGVPFIMKCGKALDERKADVRIQFKDVPGDIFHDSKTHRNELVVRLQPDEAVYLKMNIKSPGLRSRPMQAELDVTYKSRFENDRLPDAYERLILDVLRGQQGSFVRTDELAEAWRIFTPLLHQIDSGAAKPIPYAYGSRGPPEGDEQAVKAGYVYHKGTYIWGGEASENAQQ